MSTNKINVSEWLIELERLSAEQPEGVTVRELARAMNKTFRGVQILIGEQVLAGKVEFVGKRKAVGIAGQAIWTPVYRLKSQKKKSTA